MRFATKNSEHAVKVDQEKRAENSNGHHAFNDVMKSIGVIPVTVEHSALHVLYLGLSCSLHDGWLAVCAGTHIVSPIDNKVSAGYHIPQSAS